MDQNGSPLMVYMKKIKTKIEKRFSHSDVDFHFNIAMRYVIPLLKGVK